MLKHSDVIEKLTPLQKVALVSSALEDEALAQAGLPSVGRADLDALGAQKGVSYASAARSWDPALVGAVTEELVLEAGAEGARLFVTPDLKAAVDPRRTALSEDGLLCGAMGAETIRSVHAAGGAAGLSRVSADAADVAYLDKLEDVSAVHALFVKPFVRASKEDAADAIFLTPNKISSGYPDTNRALFNDALDGYFGKDRFLVGENVAPVSDSLAFLQSRTCLGGTKLPMERAARRYRQLAGYCREGSVSERDLKEAVRDGSALADEKLDEAADEVVDFCLRVSSLAPGLTYETLPSSEDGEGEGIAVPVQKQAGTAARSRAAEESIVLLNNRDGLLPFPAGTRLSVLGDAYADLGSLGDRFEIVGRARGYERGVDRSDALVREAVRVSAEADAVLVFLYPDDERRLFGLPANRVALLSALEKAGKKVVALIAGDAAVDAKFDKNLAATLVVPSDGPFAGEALARVLSGEANPSGRLTRTYYDNASSVFSSLKRNKEEGKIKVGPFVGYRRYDRAGEAVRYPFGFGLSYTSFRYAGLKTEGNVLSFTLQNVGTRDGSEVVQIYVGAPAKTHVVPRKELKAFRKIFLKAGESATVSFEIENEWFATFDDSAFAENVEGGIYKIYIGSSVLDIRLKTKRTVEGATRARSDEKYYDYFLGKDAGYASEVRAKSRLSRDKSETVPKKLRTARSAAIYALPAFAIVFFLLVSVFVLTFAVEFSMEVLLDKAGVQWALYIISILIFGILPLLGSFNRKKLSVFRTISLVISPILFFVVFCLGFFLAREGQNEIVYFFIVVVSCLAIGLFVSAMVALALERELAKANGGTNRWEKFYIKQDEKTTTTPKKEFEEAFRAAEEERRRRPVRADRMEPAPDIPQFYDRFLTFETMRKDVDLFLRERGVTVPENDLCNWLAALSASQVIVVPSGSGALLCVATAEFFGLPAYIDNAEQYFRSDDLLANWSRGEHANVKTKLALAIRDAQKNGAYLHTALVRHADADRLAQVFGPLAETVARRTTALRFPDGAEEILPPNLRIVIELDEESVSKIPETLAEVAAVLLPAAEESEPAARKTVLQAVGYERFAALLHAVRDEYPVPENLWKGVDRLDERCRSARIGNRLWVKTELHASVMAACGFEGGEALNAALAAELFPWVAATWDDEVCGEPLSATVAELLGAKAAEGVRTVERVKTSEEELDPLAVLSAPVKAEPAKPIEPARPFEAVRPLAPAKPAETVKAAEPVKPAEPVKAAEPAKPAEPVKEAEPVKPGEPAKPAEPVKSVEPVKAAEPVKPAATTATKPAATTATKPAATTATKPAATPATKPAATPATKPATTAAAKPAATTATKPATTTAAKPAATSAKPSETTKSGEGDKS